MVRDCVHVRVLCGCARVNVWARATCVRVCIRASGQVCAQTCVRACVCVCDLSVCLGMYACVFVLSHVDQ